MRIVSENLLTKITRKQYSTIHGKVFELWGRYEDGEISTSKQTARGPKNCMFWAMIEAEGEVGIP